MSCGMSPPLADYSTFLSGGDGSRSWRRTWKLPNIAFAFSNCPADLFMLHCMLLFKVYGIGSIESLVLRSELLSLLLMPRTEPSLEVSVEEGKLENVQEDYKCVHGH